MTGQPPAIRRAAALSLLALLVAALWLGPVSAYLGLVGAGSDEIARQAGLLQRERALLRQSPAPPADRNAAALMLPQLPEAQAVVYLQEAVKRAAAANHVEIRSLQVLHAESAGGDGRIGVRIDAAGGMDGLGRLLYALESGKPALVPDDLRVQARPAVANAPELLDFRLDVTGFMAEAPR